MLGYTFIANIVDLQEGEIFVNSLKACEEVKVWFHSVPVTHKFYNVLCHHYWRGG